MGHCVHGAGHPGSARPWAPSKSPSAPGRRSPRPAGSSPSGCSGAPRPRGSCLPQERGRGQSAPHGLGSAEGQDQGHTASSPLLLLAWLEQVGSLGLGLGHVTASAVNPFTAGSQGSRSSSESPAWLQWGAQSRCPFMQPRAPRSACAHSHGAVCDVAHAVHSTTWLPPASAGTEHPWGLKPGKLLQPLPCAPKPACPGQGLACHLPRVRMGGTHDCSL